MASLTLKSLRLGYLWLLFVFVLHAPSIVKSLTLGIWNLTLFPSIPHYSTLFTFLNSWFNSTSPLLQTRPVILSQTLFLLLFSPLSPPPFLPLNTWSWHLMLADFELKTLLFQPLTRWNYRCTLPCLTQTRLFSNEKDTMMSVSENCRLNSGHWCTASAFGSSHATYWLYCLLPCDSLKCVLHLALTSACAKSFTLSKLLLKKISCPAQKAYP